MNTQPTKAEIEQLLLRQLRELPDEAARELLDFATKLAQQTPTPIRAKRKLGALQGKAAFHMSPNFEMSDEEFLDQ